MRYKKLTLSLFLACVILLGLILPFESSSLAQNQETSISKNIKRTDEETREELKETEVLKKEKKNFVYDFGGWITSYFWRYEDRDGRKDNTSVRNTNYQDLRLWLKSTLFQKHLLYLRIKNSYISVRDTSSSYSGIADDFDGPHLDLAYLNLALFNPWRFIIGRQHLFLGKGIAYNQIHDGVQLNVDYPAVSLKIFCAKTKPREHHIDFSIPGYDKKGWQLFSGMQVSAIKNSNLVPYLYFLYEKDHPKEDPEDLTQDYNYDAMFYGSGIKGKTGKNLSWWLEAIKETGESYTDAYSVYPEKKNIDAWATVAGAKYSFECPTHPIVDIEYAWGSGDKDRQSTTNTSGGGNLYNDDTGFQYFGYYFSGYRLDTRLSNIQIYRLGLSLIPLEKFKFGKNILIGAKFFVYRKDKKSAGIYEDTPTPGISDDIGKEINLYLYWLITPKLTWAVRYGTFFPGGAYSGQTDAATQYFNTYLSLKF
jgi:hypothetical protein